MMRVNSAMKRIIGPGLHSCRLGHPQEGHSEASEYPRRDRFVTAVTSVVAPAGPRGALGRESIGDPWRSPGVRGVPQRVPGDGPLDLLIRILGPSGKGVWQLHT